MDHKEIERIVSFIAVSDIHGNMKAIHAITNFLRGKDVDALLVAGDLAKDPSKLEYSMPILKNSSPKSIEFYIQKMIKEQKNSLRDVLNELGKLNLPVFVVPGNQDHPEIHELLDSTSLIYNIDKKALKFKSLWLIGLGGCNYTPSAKTFYEWDEKSAWRILEMLFSKCNNNRTLLLSHSPPLGTELDITHDNVHIGSYSVRLAIEKFKPIICVCGHVHEAPGIIRMSETVVINPGSFEVQGVSEDYKYCLMAEILVDDNEIKKAKILVFS